MNTFQGYLRTQQLAHPQPAKKKQEIPLTTSLDYCYRFRPLFDKSTFEEELAYTEGEIVAYFPKNIREQYQSYQNTTKYITIAFWIGAFSFAAFCHKISLLNRLLGQQNWKIFTFKISALVLPYVAMDQVMPLAEGEELSYLWENMRQSYRVYKYTGDILKLNKQIELVGGGLEEEGRTINDL